MLKLKGADMNPNEFDEWAEEFEALLAAGYFGWPIEKEGEA